MSNLPVWRSRTVWVIGVTVGVLIGWDLIAFFSVPQGVDNATISRQALDWCTEHPSVALAFGILLAHFTWPIPRRARIRRAWRSVGLVGVMAGAVALDAFGFLPKILPIVYVAAGLPLGRYLWPQRRR